MEDCCSSAEPMPRSSSVAGLEPRRRCRVDTAEWIRPSGYGRVDTAEWIRPSGYGGEQTVGSYGGADALGDAPTFVPDGACPLGAAPEDACGAVVVDVGGGGVIGAPDAESGGVETVVGAPPRNCMSTCSVCGSWTIST